MNLTERVEFTAGLLMQAARAADMVVSGDQRVGEADLEVLLGYAPRTLRQLREEGRAAPAYHIGNRWTYRLCDVALWLENQRQDW